MKADTVDKVLENWEQIKLKEKDGNKSVLSGVPAALPSLIKAYRIQDKARNVGLTGKIRAMSGLKLEKNFLSLKQNCVGVIMTLQKKSWAISCLVS